MEKITQLIKQHKSIAAILGLSLLFAIALPFLVGKTVTIPVGATPTPQPTAHASTTVTYPGEAGKDALTLLKAQTTVGKDTSGMVNAIGGKKADTAKHEYWAFYVNGKMSQVGPADYQTKDGDKIEWKIEKY